MGLLWNDLKCRLLQKLVFAKTAKGQKPNSFAPHAEPGERRMASGGLCHSDLCYGTEYPNSFFDLWLPDDSEKIRPVFLNIHGGGFLFGDKTSGDPLAAGSGGNSRQQKLLRAGYAVVNMNYAFAPDYRFPVQIQQVDQLLRHLTEHAQEYHLDMSRVCLGGGSAGADMTEIYGVCVVNPDYAAQLGIKPVMTMENLRCLVIDEAALDSRTYDKNMYIMLMGWLGDANWNYQGKHLLMNAKEHIRDHYIPAWINTSNRGVYFEREADDLAAILRRISCEHELIHFTKEQADLDHGYVDLLDTNPWAKQAFESLLLFVSKHISDKETNR